MKDIKSILNEVKGENAHRQAVQMGLKYKGFGYWVDPNTGEVTHKTENDQLVEVEPDVESEKADKGGPEAAGAAPSGGMGNPEGLGGSFGTFMNKQLPTGMGTNVQGIADNGFAQAPNTDNGRWEPGPDGDTFAGDVEVSQTMADWNKPKKDAYVGKTNHYGWTAGKDGDNYTTMTMDQILKKAYSINLDDYESREVPMTEEEDVLGKADIFKKVAGFDPVDSQDPTHIQRGAQNFAALDASGKGSAMRSMLRQPDTYGMEIAADRMDRRVERRDRLKNMNNSLQELVQDKDYDMKDVGRELGSGMFGTVYESKDGKNVIKEGQIGRKELAVLALMKDNPAFPNLINAKLDTEFQAEDDYGDSWWDEQEHADGTIAMSRMKGIPFADAEDELTPEDIQQFVQKLHNARGKMHMAGISHNDMHGGNVFIDDEGNPSILDLGLASDDPLTALMEAIGGISGEDYQLTPKARISQFRVFPEALKDKLLSNRDEVLDRIRELMEEHESTEGMDENSDDFLDIMQDRDADINDIGEGGIRLSRDRLGNLREAMPFLENNDTVKELIGMLYNNVMDTETGQRMSNAYDKLQADRRKVALANLLRKQRGEAPIQDKLKDVLDPDN
jgi:hypothetical protein